MKFLSLVLFSAGLVATSPAAFAQKAYGPGVSDTEIKIGNAIPYSGPASAYGIIGEAESAYYNMINAKGGVNGRKINFISYDDAYSPPKTVEQVRKLVEQDGILAYTGPSCTPCNAAIHKYMNQKKVPHLFLLTGASKWYDPEHFPWTVPLYPSYEDEGRFAGKYFKQTNPDGKIAILYQNDDAGKDPVKGFKAGLGDDVSKIVAERSYEITQPTIDSEIAALKASGAEKVFIMATPKFGAQALKKIGELNWKPLIYITKVTSGIKNVLIPAGVENSTGVLSALFMKEPSDPRWADSPDMKEYFAFMKEWMPNKDPNDTAIVSGYIAAWMTVKVLRECGDNLTRENVLKVATNQKDVVHPLVLPGITLSITPDDYSGYKAHQMMRFNGTTWEPFGPLTRADAL